MIGIDRQFNDIENYLSEISFLPVAGTLAGGCKVLLGTVQLTTALASAILILIPSTITCDFRYFSYCCVHIKHGFGNISAGILEALPIIQSLFYLIRMSKTVNASTNQARIYTHHENKFMPYFSLVIRDWDFAGADEDEVKKAKQALAKRMKDWVGYVSEVQKFKFAVEVLKSRYKHPTLP